MTHSIKWRDPESKTEIFYSIVSVIHGNSRYDYRRRRSDLTGDGTSADDTPFTPGPSCKVPR